MISKKDRFGATKGYFVILSDEYSDNTPDQAKEMAAELDKPLKRLEEDDSGEVYGIIVKKSEIEKALEVSGLDEEDSVFKIEKIDGEFYTLSNSEGDSFEVSVYDMDKEDSPDDSEDLLGEHSEDLTFEVYTSDIIKHGNYKGSLNQLAGAIQNAGLQVTGTRDNNGIKMIIKASTPAECTALEQVLQDFKLNQEFIDFVMADPLQHDGMNYNQAREVEEDVPFESVKSPFERKKVLESLRLNEGFSKAQREKMVEEGVAMKDGSFPIRNKADLKKAIQSVGRAKDVEKAKNWIKKRAKALGYKDMIPEDWSSAKSVNEAIKGGWLVMLSDEYSDRTPSEAYEIARKLRTYLMQITDLDVNGQPAYGVFAFDQRELGKIQYITNAPDEDIYEISDVLGSYRPKFEFILTNFEGDTIHVEAVEANPDNLNEAKKEEVCSPYGKVKVNGKKLCECGKGELRQMLREAKQELNGLKKEQKSLKEDASKREKNKLAKKIEKASKLCEILEEEIKFNPKKAGAVNEAESLYAQFTQWAKLFEADEEEEEDEDDKADDKEGEEKDKEAEDKKDEQEEAELEAIVLTVKDVEKVKENLVNAGIPEEHIEVIADSEDENSKEGKLRVDAEDAMTLKDYLSKLGIDLEEEIGAELVDDEETEETSDETGGEEDDKGGVDDSEVELSADDIFGDK